MLPYYQGSGMSHQQSRHKTQAAKTQSAATPVSIPDKLYFRIGDVAQLCDLQAYVLRYWETEFPQLRPNKGGTGQRLYRKRDVELVLEIKRLLYAEGFTIAGARRLLAEKRTHGKLEDVEKNSPGKIELARMQSAAPSDQPKPASVHASADAGRTSKEPAMKPQLHDLRREMRELLNLLGADAPAVSLAASRRRREPKKGDASEPEPTLFS